MTAAKCSDADFLHLVETHGATEAARRLKINTRAVQNRRVRLEAKLGRQIRVPDAIRGTRVGANHPNRAAFEIQDGVVLVGSDPHYWPGAKTIAHKAFVKFCKELKPKAIIMNGDVLDGSTISRHPPINWEQRPTLIDEIEVAQERLVEIENAAPPKATLIWPLGNHDARLETRLATVAPEFARMKGFHLKDHFGPRWIPCWAAWINGGSVVVKHRWKSGVHGVFQNTVSAGVTMVTGHDHALRVSPYTDYTGDRYGVSTGTLAEPDGPQFDYNEDNPKNHRSGFCVLSFHKGKLLPPELVSVFDANHIVFRGQVIRV